MGVVRHTECTGCGRSGSAHEDTNFIFTCFRCEQENMKYHIQKSVQQVWWIRFLYWLTDKRAFSYNENNCEVLLKELF